MSSIITKSVLCIFVFLGGCLAGRTAFNRITSLDELKEIDSYVATGLPVFEHGFFIETAQGPVLVKAAEEGTKTNKPRLNPGYYSTLPRLIPAGFEGLSISHFNLGSSIPAQSPSILNHDQRSHFDQGQNSFQYAQPSVQIPQQFRQHQHDDRFTRRSYHQSPIAQDTFQISNFLNQDDDYPTSYQNTMMSHDGSFGLRTRNLRRNPTVEQAFEFEDELPENLKNRFYKNEALASVLARESLPLEGEEIVGQWDTTKIQKNKIHSLLLDAGFLRR